MKLKTLEINKFRGATQPLKLEFNPAKSITMIFGENGNGKSSIADAMIALCTDNLGSIRDKSSADKGFIKSLGCAANEVSLKLNTDKGTFVAKLNSSGSTFLKTPESGAPSVRHLRRSHIIHLIDSEPGKRYEVLKDYIDVAEIMKCEEELRKAKKITSETFQKLKTTITAAITVLENTWKAEGSPMTTWKLWAKSESDKDISKLIERQNKILQLIKDWNNVVSKRDEVKKTVVKYNVDLAKEKAAVIKIEELNKANPLADFSILQVLTEANSYISGKGKLDQCPVCDQGIIKEELLTSLSDKIAKMKEFQSAQKSLADLKKVREQTEATLKTQIDSFIEDLDVFIPSIKALLDPVDKLLTVLTGIEVLSTNNEKYKSLNIKGSEINLKMLDFKSESDKIEKSKNQHNLIKQQFNALVSSTKESGKAEKLANAAENALTIVEKCRKDFIDGELASISSDVETLYQKMHPGESLGGIKLFLKANVKNSIELNADFYSEESITPQSVYSESHLDTLGICIFLALAKKYNDKDTVLILDDVVMSVDETHLDRFIDLLHDQVSFFAHILITTHYRPWKDRYRFSRAPSHDVHFVELRNWNINTGIRMQNGKIDLEELKKALDSSDFDRQRISSLAGTVLENVLDFISIKYHCKVPRKPRNEYVLRELLDCISGRLQKVLKVQRFEKNDLGKYDYSVVSREQDLKPLLDSLKKLAAIRNQVGAHFNFDGSMVSDNDVMEFGTLVYEFTEHLVCPEKGNFPEKDKSGSYFETSSGSIRLFPLSEPAV
ncbi:hypothetical protein AQ505_16700 [Pedobacter sp. PACM 27299]|uniref:AAA family ATPase n=1 Tax=Pedobacter sp. PACM 27299 TaxID=1727164 RepID=UPI0007069548|nr:AAA family ATPase [Pedobacter sp. PACM 27299]ALL06980.1 hypothetical protein AQ505_16700 [Pedobacter sp. PACM 27299]